MNDVKVQRFRPGAMTIRVRLARRLKLRMWLALQLVRLAGRLIGAGVVCEREAIPVVEA